MTLELIRWNFIDTYLPLSVQLFLSPTVSRTQKGRRKKASAPVTLQGNLSEHKIFRLLVVACNNEDDDDDEYTAWIVFV